MKLLLILFLLPLLSFANGVDTTTQATHVSTSSGAVAQTSGNTQGIILNSNTPGTQTIITTPGLAGMYIPSSNECYPAWGAQATGPGAAAGVTSATLSYPCHVKDTAQRIASMAVAAFNIGLRDRGRESMENALDYAECAFPDNYIIRKVKGQKCPVKPDWHFGDMLLGGMPRETIEPVNGYVYEPTMVTEQGQIPPVNTDQFVTRDELNNKLDNVQEKAMLK